MLKKIGYAALMGGAVFTAQAAGASPAAAWKIVESKSKTKSSKETAAEGKAAIAGPADLALEEPDKSGNYMLQIYCPNYEIYNPDTAITPPPHMIAISRIKAGAAPAAGDADVAVHYQVMRKGGPVPFPRRGVLRGEVKDGDNYFRTINGADFVADLVNFESDYPGELHLSFPANFRSGDKVLIAYNLDGLLDIYNDFRRRCANGGSQLRH